MRCKFLTRFCIPLLAAGLSACAASLPEDGYSLANGADTSAAAPGYHTASSPRTVYQLSEEEKSLDCRRLTGRMKIRIVQMKDTASHQPTSEVARAMQTAQSQFGGSTWGMDPDADAAKDRAMLEAYNAQLQAKGCTTLDLAAELSPAMTPAATAR
jgi:hypothetical protein